MFFINLHLFFVSRLISMPWLYRHVLDASGFDRDTTAVAVMHSPMPRDLNRSVSAFLILSKSSRTPLSSCESSV
jgi:hypothetical protein